MNDKTKKVAVVQFELHDLGFRKRIRATRNFRVLDGMSSIAKSARDRAPKCSIVLSNVLAVVFRPTSTAVQLNNLHHDENCEHKDSKPSHQLSGLELFDSFKEANRSTMLTRLTESLDEIRLKGWVFPFTLLIKGPHEDVEVIKEAWRRHFLRSPDNFIIKHIGKLSYYSLFLLQAL